MNRKTNIAISAAILALLSACGGGGGGDTPTAVQSSGDVVVAPSPAPAASDPVPVVPVVPVVPASPLLAGAEDRPLLSAPQVGSTAAGSDSTEGVYNSFSGFALIGPNGQISIRTVVAWVFGGITLSTDRLSWNFDSGSSELFISSVPINGSGTVSQTKTLAGTYNYNTNPTATPKSVQLTYSVANALAVDQTSVSGTWTSTGISLVIDSAGTLSGTTSGASLGTCSLTGTAPLTTQNSKKNLYGLSFVATGTGCNLTLNSAYTGHAAIEFIPAGTFVNQGYYRGLAFIVKTAGGAALSAIPKKQP